MSARTKPDPHADFAWVRHWMAQHEKCTNQHAPIATLDRFAQAYGEQAEQHRAMLEALQEAVASEQLDKRRDLLARAAILKAKGEA